LGVIITGITKRTESQLARSLVFLRLGKQLAKQYTLKNKKLPDTTE
jgi:hypothetical protein